MQFLALDVVLFLLYFLNGDASRALPDRVVVDETDVARLTEQFQCTSMRPPTRKELEGLAEDFVKEEVLYREAVALGLDRDDPIMRRRMRQKMEFLNADLTEQAAAEPAGIPGRQSGEVRRPRSLQLSADLHQSGSFRRR